MGLPSTPYFLCFHYFGSVVAHSHFSTSYTAHSLLFLSFRTPFKPIYLLKAHLFILWACDPLFLPLGLSGFSICLPTLFCSCCWAFPFHLGFRNGHQQFSGYFITWTCSCIANQISSFTMQNYHLTPYSVAKQCSWWCYLGGLIHSSAAISTSCGQDVLMERVMLGV